MGKSISISTPREPNASLIHDRREYEDDKFPDNIDRTRTQYNVMYENHSLFEVYENVFGEAITEYDEHQPRKDRKIGSAKKYIEKIARSKQQTELNEVILQFGDKFSNGFNGDLKDEDYQLASKMLDELASRIKDKYPNFATVCMIKHMDEATPHIHWAFVPFGHYDKGQKVRVSVDRACKEMNFNGKNNVPPIQMVLEDIRAEMETIAKNHGLSIEHPSGKTQHQRINDYKKDAQKIRDELDSLPAPEQLNVRPNMFDKNKVVLPKEDYDALLKRVKLTEYHNSIVDKLMAEIESFKARANEYLKTVKDNAEKLILTIRKYKKATKRISPDHIKELETKITDVQTRADKAEQTINLQNKTINELKKKNHDLTKRIKEEWHNGWTLGRESGLSDGYSNCLKEYNITPRSRSKDYSL